MAIAASGEEGPKVVVHLWGNVSKQRRTTTDDNLLPTRRTILDCRYRRDSTKDVGLQGAATNELVAIDWNN